MSATAPPTASASTIFIAFAVLTAASFGASILLLIGAGRSTSAEPTPTRTPVVTQAPARTAAPQTTAAAGARVRVMSATGRSVAQQGGTHRVTFVWTLEGAREGDQAVVHFYAGTQSLGEQRGTLDRSVFAFATGTFTLAVELPCSSTGWSAEIIRVREMPIDGDSLATVPGVTCQ
jgi:hypothetical protein